ncbi:MAG: transposase [Patescibacteria group bacterium]
MPIRKIQFVEGEIYHIYNRGVEKRNIFMEEKDYLRAIHDMYEFNDENPTDNLYYRSPSLTSYETRSRKVRKMIVEILAFALMPNHYHFLLRPIHDKGISKFMHKFGLGYAMYFNKKYERSGTLFQGPFRAIHIEREAHFLHLPFYIHANPLDIKFPEWRDGRLKNYRAAMNYLETYRWSSFPDYIGKRNFPSVTSRGFLSSVFGSPKEYQKTTFQLLKEMNLSEIEDVILE